MIYEFRTYTLHPRGVPEFFKRWEPLIAKRQEISRLAACWTTEIGPLNQVIHVWEYKDLNERNAKRAEAQKSGNWPPKTQDLIANMQSDIMIPQPFSPPFSPSNHGPYFEMRIYTTKPGGIPEMAERWKGAIAGRMKLSPLIGVFTTDLGELNQWIHIWAYKSLDERVAIRKQAMATGTWPPPGGSGPNPVIRQETKILTAAPFSPVK